MTFRQSASSALLKAKIVPIQALSDCLPSATTSRSGPYASETPHSAAIIKPRGFDLLAATKLVIALLSSAVRSVLGRFASGRQSPFTGSRDDGAAQLRTCSQASSRADSLISVRQA